MPSVKGREQSTVHLISSWPIEVAWGLKEVLDAADEGAEGNRKVLQLWRAQRALTNNQYSPM